MIAEPKCYTRQCVHYLGVNQSDGTELTEVNICAAYLEGIPFDIAYEGSKHLTVRPDQDNDIVFEAKS